MGRFGWRSPPSAWLPATMSTSFRHDKKISTSHAEQLKTGRRRKSRAPKNTLSSIVAAQPAAKKLKELRQREAERQRRIQVQVETWFEKFDENGDGKLQRTERADPKFEPANLPCICLCAHLLTMCMFESRLSSRGAPHLASSITPANGREPRLSH